MKKSIVGIMFMATASIGSTAMGVNYVIQGPFVVPVAGPGLPTPAQVPGKEFTQNLDRDSLGVLNPGQVLNWDGAGGTADGAFDYVGANAYNNSGDGPFIHPTGEVDGLANNRDVLFNELRSNTSHLVFGVQNNGAYLYEHTSGAKGVWAAPAQIDALTPPTSAHDVELWGHETGNDADRYSLVGDGGGAAVYRSDGTVEFTDAELAAGIASLYNRNDVAADLANVLDLDAMMVFDLNSQTRSLIFSVAPVSVGVPANPLGLDGGEIFVYDVTVAGSTMTWLNHGGHLWDTAFNVTALGFGGENVTALEAISMVPEPASLAIMGVAGALLMMRRRK